MRENEFRERKCGERERMVLCLGLGEDDDDDGTVDNKNLGFVVVLLNHFF